MQNEHGNYIASLFPGQSKPLPKDFVTLIKALQDELEMPIWLLIQQGESERSGQDVNSIGVHVRNLFLRARADLPTGQPIALVVDSPGGGAREAYQIASLIQRQCGSFIAVIPRLAKSAATLLVLGADDLIMGKHAELGPLDVQRWDPEREEQASGLDEVQSLQRLSAAALEMIDKTILHLINRTHKSVESLLPVTLNYVTQIIRPLIEGIDVIHYTKTARLLKVAEDYGVRLLSAITSREDAQKTASRLIEDYSEHGFVIDRLEARSLGLPIDDHTDEIEAIVDGLLSHLLEHRSTYIGHVKEV